MPAIYYDRDGITIWHADYRAILPAIPDASIGLVLTDPPYAEETHAGARTNPDWARRALAPLARSPPSGSASRPRFGGNAMAGKRTPPGTEMSAADFRAWQAAQVTEEAFRRAVRRHAADRGWDHQYHTRFSIGSDPGFPDEVYLRGPRCVVIECKRVGKGPTERQVSWLDAWNLIPGVEAYCLTPADWDVIERVLF